MEQIMNKINNVGDDNGDGVGTNTNANNNANINVNNNANNNANTIANNNVSNNENINISNSANNRKRKRNIINLSKKDKKITTQKIVSISFLAPIIDNNLLKLINISYSYFCSQIENIKEKIKNILSDKNLLWMYNDKLGIYIPTLEQYMEKYVNFREKKKIKIKKSLCSKNNKNVGYYDILTKFCGVFEKKQQALNHCRNTKSNGVFAVLGENYAWIPLTNNFDSNTEQKMNNTAHQNIKYKEICKNRFDERRKVIKSNNNYFKSKGLSSLIPKKNGEWILEKGELDELIINDATNNLLPKRKDKKNYISSLINMEYSKEDKLEKDKIGINKKQKWLCLKFILPEEKNVKYLECTICNAFLQGYIFKYIKYVISKYFEHWKQNNTNVNNTNANNTNANNTNANSIGANNTNANSIDANNTNANNTNANNTNVNNTNANNTNANNTNANNACGVGNIVVNTEDKKGENNIHLVDIFDKLGFIYDVKNVDGLYDDKTFKENKKISRKLDNKNLFAEFIDKLKVKFNTENSGEINNEKNNEKNNETSKLILPEFLNSIKYRGAFPTTTMANKDVKEYMELRDKITNTIIAEGFSWVIFDPPSELFQRQITNKIKYDMFMQERNKNKKHKNMFLGEIGSTDTTKGEEYAEYSDIMSQIKNTYPQSTNNNKKTNIIESTSSNMTTSSNTAISSNIPINKIIIDDKNSAPTNVVVNVKTNNMPIVDENKVNTMMFEMSNLK